MYESHYIYKKANGGGWAMWIEVWWETHQENVWSVGTTQEVDQEQLGSKKWSKQLKTEIFKGSNRAAVIEYGRVEKENQLSSVIFHLALAELRLRRGQKKFLLVGFIKV